MAERWTGVHGFEELCAQLKGQGVVTISTCARGATSLRDLKWRATLREVEAQAELWESRLRTHYVLYTAPG